MNYILIKFFQNVELSKYLENHQMLISFKEELSLFKWTSDTPEIIPITKIKWPISLELFGNIRLVLMTVNIECQIYVDPILRMCYTVLYWCWTSRLSKLRYITACSQMFIIIIFFIYTMWIDLMQLFHNSVHIILIRIFMARSREDFR